MTKTKVPIDIFSVKEYGVDKWQKSFFCPVSDDEFASLYEDVTQGFTCEIKKQQKLIKILLIIQYPFLIFECINFLHVLKTIQKIHSLKMDVLYSDKTSWYKNILTGEDIDVNMSRINVDINSNVGFIENVKSFIKSIIFNRNIFSYFFSRKNKEDIKLLGSFNPLIKDYLKLRPNWVYFTSRRNWLPKDTHFILSERLKNKLQQSSKAMVNRLVIAAEKRGIELLDKHKEHFERLIEEELSNTAKILHLVKHKISNKKRIHLLMPARGNKFYLTVGMAVQECGGTVTNFAHGGDTGFLNMPMLLASYFDMPLVNNFVTYTTESAKLYDKIKARYSRCKSNSLNIISANSGKYLKLRKRYNKKSFPVENRRIMIIGYPHQQWRKPLTGASSLIHLDLELRLIDFLKKAGYDTLYKVHPNRIAETRGIFEDKVKVLKGYMQQHLDKTDAFLFPTLATTAFSIALCTNKTIITLDLSYKSQRYKPFPEAVELMKKRCRIVNTEFDERKRIIFDKNGLLDALSRKPEPPNTEFIEKYMFPEKIKMGKI